MSRRCRSRAASTAGAPREIAAGITSRAQRGAMMDLGWTKHHNVRNPMSDDTHRPPMMPAWSSEERLTLDELHESTELLSLYRTVVGEIPDETIALMKTLLIRRDGGARVILTHLRWCLTYEESA